MLSHADFEPFVKSLGVPGSEHAGATPRRWLAIERLRRRTGLTWVELIQPALRRPPIIIRPRQPQAAILARGLTFKDRRTCQFQGGCVTVTGPD
jgi:hypothetical protein